MRLILACGGDSDCRYIHRRAATCALFGFVRPAQSPECAPTEPSLPKRELTNMIERKQYAGAESRLEYDSVTDGTRCEFQAEQDSVGPIRSNAPQIRLAFREHIPRPACHDFELLRFSMAHSDSGTTRSFPLLRARLEWSRFSH